MHMKVQAWYLIHGQCQGHRFLPFLPKKQLTTTSQDLSSSTYLDRSLGAWQTFMTEEKWTLNRNLSRYSKIKNVEFLNERLAVELVVLWNNVLSLSICGQMVFTSFILSLLVFFPFCLKVFRHSLFYSECYIFQADIYLTQNHLFSLNSVSDACLDRIHFFRSLLENFHR